MSASSKPTRRPRSRRPNARLSAVVDLPTPPLPEAPAITAAIPGISDCFDIGDAGLCGGRCDETGGTPCACRCGGGAAEPGLRSAVSAIMATATPPWPAYREPVAVLRSRRISWLCSDATHRAVLLKRLPAPDVIHALGGR